MRLANAKIATPSYISTENILTRNKPTTLSRDEINIMKKGSA